MQEQCCSQLSSALGHTICCGGEKTKQIWGWGMEKRLVYAELNERCPWGGFGSLHRSGGHQNGIAAIANHPKSNRTAELALQDLWFIVKLLRLFSTVLTERTVSPFVGRTKSWNNLLLIRHPVAQNNLKGGWQLLSQVSANRLCSFKGCLAELWESCGFCPTSSTEPKCPSATERETVGRTLEKGAFPWILHWENSQLPWNVLEVWTLGLV